MAFKNLSNDEIKRILLYEPIENVKNYCQTDRRANYICNDDYLWEKLTKRDFGDAVGKIGRYWRETYQILSRPIYEIIYVQRFPNNPTTIESELFYSEDRALDWLFSELSENIFMFVPYQRIQTSDLSDEFQKIIFDGEELMEDYFVDDPILLRDFQIYSKRVKDYIINELVLNGKVDDGNNYETIFLNKRIPKF